MEKDFSHVSEIRKWRKNFLNKRGLERPNGEDLYTYKMTKGEFNELEQLFQQWLKQRLKLNSLSDLVTRYSIFNEHFVIYAAEWWKRRYEGGHWTWKPILESLGIASENWPASKRSECIKKGFRIWSISIRNSAGKRFLGSIAIQGGLPMNLMAQNQGTVSRVLHRVIDLLPGSKVEYSLIVSWIENLSGYLPKTYQREEIYDLLTEVVLVIKQIKSESLSKEPEDVLNEWRGNKDKWKRKFPISVSDNKTLHIIENLVKKVAQTKTNRHSGFISFNRYFDFHGDGDERLHVKITFKNVISEEGLKDLFGINAQELGSNLSIAIKCGNDSKEISLRKLIGEDKYKLAESVVDEFSGLNATKEITFILRDRRGNSWNKNIEKGEELDEDLPWIFIFDDDEHMAYESQGSGKISGKEYVIIAKDTLDLFADGSLIKIDKLFKQFNVYKADSRVNIRNSNDDEFRIINEYAGNNRGEIIISGNEVSELFVTPTRAYRGKPKLIEISDIRSNKYLGDIQWKVGGNDNRLASNKMLGPVTAVKREGRFVLWRKKMVVLPPDSSEEMLQGENASSGYWKFKNWELEVVKPVTSNIVAENIEGDLWHFKYIGKGTAPASFDAKFIWRGNAAPAKLNLQFPSQGVRAFDKRGNEIFTDALLSIDKLHGHRVYIMPGDCKIIQVELKTRNSSRLIKLSFDERDYIKEIRLNEYHEIFEKMLSLSSDIDEVVNFRIYFDSRQKFSLDIARYSFILKKIGDKWYVPGNVLNKISNENSENNLDIRTQRLDVPGVEDLPVPLRESGYLDFPEEAKSTGPWIIYPSNESDLMMRPVLHKINGSVGQSGEEGLKAALNEPDEKRRFEKIDSVIQELTTDPEHEDWEEISRLAKEYGHLPLNAIDIWGRAILNYDFMAMLAVGKISLPDRFVDRFSLELPFLFEFIPLKSWKKAIVWEKRKLEDYLQEEDLYAVIKQKCNVSEWIFDAFRHGYLIALNECIGPYDHSLKAANLGTINYQLHKSSNSFYQKLRRRKDSSKQWPTFKELDNLIKSYRREFGEFFFSKQQYRTVVVNTPILLAGISYQNIEEGQFQRPDFVQLIRRVKEFDEPWFTNSYNFSLLKHFYVEQ